MQEVVYKLIKVHGMSLVNKSDEPVNVREAMLIDFDRVIEHADIKPVQAYPHDRPQPLT